MGLSRCFGTDPVGAIFMSRKGRGRPRKVHLQIKQFGIFIGSIRSLCILSLSIFLCFEALYENFTWFDYSPTCRICIGLFYDHSICDVHDFPGPMPRYTLMEQRNAKLVQVFKSGIVKKAWLGGRSTCACWLRRGTCHVLPAQ